MKTLTAKEYRTFEVLAKKYKLQDRTPLILTISIVILLGSHLLYTGHAATFAASHEAETGTIAGNAALLNGADASNGQAVKFGNISTGTPSQLKK